MITPCQQSAFDVTALVILPCFMMLVRHRSFPSRLASIPVQVAYTGASGEPTLQVATEMDCNLIDKCSNVKFMYDPVSQSASSYLTNSLEADRVDYSAGHCQSCTLPVKPVGNTGTLAVEMCVQNRSGKQNGPAVRERRT